MMLSPPLRPTLFRSMLGRLAAGLVMLGAGEAVADQLPPFDTTALKPFQAIYDVGNNVLSAGRATIELKRDGDFWTYSLVTRPEGVFKLTGKGRIQETSVFQLDADDPLGIKPLKYRYRQDDEKRRRVDATFDWKNNLLTYERRSEAFNEPIVEPIVDRLSGTLVIMNALRSGFKNVEIQVFDSGRLKTVRFVNDGTESLKTDMGTFDTVRVISQNRENSTRQTITWFAPELDFTPVQIEQRKRGDLVARLKLERLRDL